MAFSSVIFSPRQNQNVLFISTGVGGAAAPEIAKKGHVVSALRFLETDCFEVEDGGDRGEIGIFGMRFVSSYYAG